MENTLIKTGNNESLKTVVLGYLLKSSRVLILLILMLILTILSPSFANKTNLINVFRQAVPQIILALGMSVVLLTGGIDLSMGSTTTLAAVVVAHAMKNMHCHWMLSILIGLGVGVLIGLVNGLLITKTDLPSPVATYGMLWVGSGLAFAVMGAFPIFGFDDAFRFIGTGYIGWMPVQVIIVLVLIVIFAFFLKFTIFGRRIYAVGSNFRAATASGIKSKIVLIEAYLISGAMAAVAGVVLLSRLNAADQNSGAALLLPAIAGPVMGGTSMKGGEGGVWGAIVGSLIIVIITNGMNLLKVSSLWQQFIVGLTVVLAVWLDSILKKKSENR